MFLKSVEIVRRVASQSLGPGAVTQSVLAAPNPGKAVGGGSMVIPASHLAPHPPDVSRVNTDAVIAIVIIIS